jgi:hypothetical protein
MESLSWMPSYLSIDSLFVSIGFLGVNTNWAEAVKQTNPASVVRKIYFISKEFINY